MGSAVHQLCVSFKLITQQLREKWAVITPFHSRLDRWNALSLLANCHHIQLLFAVYYFCILIKSNYRLEKYEKHECWAFFKNRRPFSPFCVDGFATRSVNTASNISTLHAQDGWGASGSQTASQRFPGWLTRFPQTPPIPPPVTCIWVLLLFFVLYLWFCINHAPSFHIRRSSTELHLPLEWTNGGELSWLWCPRLWGTEVPPSPWWRSLVNLSNHKLCWAWPTHLLLSLRVWAIPAKVIQCWPFGSWQHGEKRWGFTFNNYNSSW